MTTWTRVNGKLDLFLDDAPRLNAAGELTPPLFEEPLRIESWNYAQRTLVHHTPRARTMTLQLESSGREAVLPDDYYTMQGIYDANNERWWRPVNWEPGNVRLSDDDSERYWTFAGRLYLEDTIDVTSTDLTLYYWAHYPDVTYTLDDGAVDTYPQSIIYTPLWAEPALAHLTACFCEFPKEIFAADINQYKIRVDSGNPLQNPRQQSALHHLDMWNRLIGLFPPTRLEAVG